MEALLTYPYSSLRDYCGAPRPEGAIVSPGSLLEVIDKIPALERILEDARTSARQNDDE